MIDINEIHNGCRSVRRKLLDLHDDEALPPPQVLPPRPPPHPPTKESVVSSDAS